MADSQLPPLGAEAVVSAPQTVEAPKPPVDALITAFNACASPKEALPLLSDHPVASVAKALHDGSPEPGLLGACIGHHAPFYQELAREYPLVFDSFKGTGVVSALRQYLWHFRLPGESAQIERIVQGFASAYYLHNHQADTTGSRHTTGAVDQSAVGFYVTQPGTEGEQGVLVNWAPGWRPASAARSPLFCVHCGVLEGQHGQTLRPCSGCGVVHFCRRCRKLASKRGHSVAGNIGYGRACLAALGLEAEGGTIKYTNGAGHRVTEAVGAVQWVSKRGCPAKSADALMVLCYAIIMLTTNLHNPKVKAKMQLHEFLQQNVGVNDGDNFPGDYLAEIYHAIAAEELKVKPTEA